MANRSISFLDNVPEYIINEYPLFVDFIRAYFEYMEQNGNPINFIHDLDAFGDIDRTTEQFLDYFKNQLLKDIPGNILCNKRTLLKHIKELYVSKGSENSYRLLFRILYNKEIEFYTTNKNILKPSDGKWNQDVSICVRISKDVSYADIEKCIGQEIDISRNGTNVKAIVRSIKKLYNYDAIDDGFHYLEFFIINNINTLNRINSL